MPTLSWKGLSKLNWKRAFAYALVIGLLGSVTVCLFPFVRPIRHDWMLDAELLAVAMDWRDFGQDKARERLGWTIQSQGLHQSFSLEDCALIEDVSGERRIRCSWSETIRVPVLSILVPMVFESVASIDAEDEIHAW